MAIDKFWSVKAAVGRNYEALKRSVATNLGPLLTQRMHRTLGIIWMATILDVHSLD